MTSGDLLATSAFDDFVPARVDVQSKVSAPLLTNIRFLPRDNLLSSIGDILSGGVRTMAVPAARLPIGTFFLSQDLVVSFNRNLAPAPLVQCFISALQERFGALLNRESGS